MELRSSRVLKWDTSNIDSSLENSGSVDEKRPSSSSDKSPSVEKGTSEVEIRVCVDNADDDLEVGCSNGAKGIITEGTKDGVNTDDKGLFLGSEVLDPIKDLVVSCPEGEIEEESVERRQVECSANHVGGECQERNRLFLTNSSDMVSVDMFHAKASAPSSPHKEIMVCENGSEHDVAIVNGNEDSENGDSATDEGRQRNGEGRRGMKKKNVGKTTQEEIQVEEALHVECQEKSVVDSSVHTDSGECTHVPVKRKRGRKRKNVESCECNGDDRGKEENVDEGGIQVSGRVLRSRTMTVCGGGKAIDGGLSGNLVGLKRMARTEFQAEVEETAQLAGRPKKKLKRRGRPPKVQSEIMHSHVKRRGRPPKLQKEGSTQLIDMPKKKRKRRGRPPKVMYETMPLHEIHSVSKRGRGRPPKVQGKEMISQGIQKNRHKDMMFMKFKRRGRPPKVQARNLATHMIKMRTMTLMAVNKRGPKVQQSAENNEHTRDADTVVKHRYGGGGAERRKEQQFVRDQIVGILLKAGWTIDRRPRPERTYKDKVYIDPKGKAHWSITKAYSMLKRKIEDGDADSNEVSAFTPIPEEEMSILFRVVNKESGDKNHKEKDKTGTGESGKKTKNGSRRKAIRNYGARWANKSSKFNQEGTHSRKPCLLARSSEKGSDQENDGCSTYSGKRNLLSWMIDLGVILPGWKVQYGKTRRQKRSSEGTITSDGIHCGCCNETMNISKFVVHAGGKLSQPFDNMYLESGTSLLKCLLDSWRREEESNTIRFNLVDIKGDDPNDDTCNICGDGGNLICCDGCPSTFHQSCLDIQNFPSGDWNCIYCSCKFCRVVSVSAPQTDDSHHALFSEMLSCCLCEEKFHRSCIQEAEAVNMDSSRLCFCGRKCQELFERLQTYLGVKFELEEGFSWTLLHRSDVGQDYSLHDSQLKVECNSKLAVAFAVMDECFVPIVDDRSGTNIIHNVVYNCGSNFRRLNYAGFFTAILEKGDELISAASIRIHGHWLAEMPFIGTRHMYRRQGMCRRLLDAIESTLGSLGVEELVIPAIPELLRTWTEVFGFMPLEESKKQAMKFMSMMVFPGIDMLQKPLLQNCSANRNPSPSADMLQEPLLQDPSANRNPSPSAVSDDKAVECMPEPNDKCDSQCQRVSSNAIDCKQRPGDAAGVDKDAVDDEQMEEAPPVIMHGCSRPEEEEEDAHFETDKSTNSHDANSLCDLNSPVNNVGLMSSDAKSEIPAQHVSSDSDVQTSDNSVLHEPDVVAFGLHQLPLLQLDTENDDIPGVKVVRKNNFDLNLHPSAVDTDIHIIGDESLPSEPRVCIKSFELPDSRSQVENSAGGLPDSKPCDAQTLVLL